MQPLSFPKLCDSIVLCRIVTHLPWAREDDGRIYKTPWKVIQREEASGLQMFHIFITSVPQSNQATFPMLPAGCRRKVSVVAHHRLTCRYDSQIERRKSGNRIYFLHQQLTHSILFSERCPLTVTSLVSLVKTDTHPLDSHSHCSVLYSVLTSTYMFYWLKRGLIPGRQNCPNLYQQFGFRKPLTQHPVGLSLLL